jgi:adenylylsulfate kinase-like enzyme
MITWITGNTGAGKTTMAKKLAGKNSIILDGNELRHVWQDLDMSREGRWEQSMRAARLAKTLARQGHDVIIAVICPYEELRREVKRMTGCLMIYLPYGRPNSEKYPYEPPQCHDVIHKRKEKNAHPSLVGEVCT